MVDMTQKIALSRRSFLRTGLAVAGATALPARSHARARSAKKGMCRHGMTKLWQVRGKEG